jgi:hypothetical protein
MRVINISCSANHEKGLTEMDDYLTGAHAGTARFDPPPVLIAGDSDAALNRATRTIEASGLRIADRLTIEGAPERLDVQIAASALWIELDADRGAPLDRLLDQVNRDSGDGRYAAIVAAPSGLLDAIDARLTDGGVALLSTATRPSAPPRWPSR